MSGSVFNCHLLFPRGRSAGGRNLNAEDLPNFAILDGKKKMNPGI